MTEKAPASLRSPIRARIKAWMRRNAISCYALALTVLLAFFAIAPSAIIAVPAGHVGVLWLRFFGGTVTDYVLGEGMHIVLPWNVLTLYDVRLRNETHRYEAVSANGWQ